ncbi:MAG: beta-ketoacyl-[acyl-carrier-protein] synthase family protein, partial [Actinomycetota bacterium]|nr:beta-ketoacyl-[acyl-carrier-protein] synthase family protein [Actinomycetota bacterium]
MTAPRVAVAGVGAITAQGPSAVDLWDGVSAGRVAIGPVTGLRLGGHPVSIGAQVQTPQPACGGVGAVEPVTGDRLVDLAVHAATEALNQSGTGLDAIAADRWAVVMASCRVGVRPDWAVGDEKSLRLDLALMPQGIAERVGTAFGLTGPVVAIDTACAGGANAVGYAADLIRLGHADAALAGGSEVLSDLTFAGFSSVEALAPDPAAPYSLSRRGLSLGEGSAMLVLVRADLGQRLGVRPLAEVLGYGLSADGYHPTAPEPSGEGAARAIAAALDASGVGPGDVAYVNGHGTGTPKNDVAETRAIRRALGPAADRVAVSSTKSMIGHMLGAAGATEATVTALALHH